MYSNKENVNILTALLVASGVRHAVVCPGSRNAPLVHNLNECRSISCYPVTDERSAGFFAIGIAQSLHGKQPVAVCVTSGSALLNAAPAIAEAFYQHLPIVLISADRPPQWIDQLDGQTLPQNDALAHFVKKEVTLPEPNNDEQRWFCARLVNEAMIAMFRSQLGPVHINVPIGEPLFDFSVQELPNLSPMIRLERNGGAESVNREFLDIFFKSCRPMIVIGQMMDMDVDDDELNIINRHAVIVHESLSQLPFATPIDEMLYAVEDKENYKPDLVVYMGDCLVSKRLKHFLRSADADFWQVSVDGEVHDTFMHLHGIVESRPAAVLRAMAAMLKNAEKDDSSALKETKEYVDCWQTIFNDVMNKAATYEPSYSQMAAVKYFEEQLQDMEYPYMVHYANSTSIRIANIYADHKVWCNRGVNGIEGCLSSAAGMSAVTDDIVFCVIGDLSFFYDQNALWNQNLKGNLRIILLNNGCGSIFRLLRGLKDSPARDNLISAGHNTQAEGVCMQNDVGYIKATNMEEMQIGMVTLLTSTHKRPMLLEILTDSKDDELTYKQYYRTLKS
jgi:2-succinyl-5-enolpyruvyl-6-hydroxy-3-cyclohexene-1-carboxylate synthase